MANLYSDRCGPGIRYTRPSTALLLSGVLLLLGACSDLFVTPAPPAAAGLGVSFSLSASGSTVGGTADAYDKANGVRVRVNRSATTVQDTVIGLRPGQQEARVRLSLEPQSSSETVQLIVDLLADGAELFRGSTSVLLQPGATVEAAVTLVPIPAGIELSAANVALPSIGDSLRIGGVVTFATGDTISGAPVQWSSSNASIASVLANGTIVAHANGSTTVTASHGDLSRDLAVSVNQVPASLVFIPDTITVRLGGTISVAPIVRDGRGNAMSGQVVGSWTTSNAVVASVDDQGRVTGLATGSALITARIGAVNGSITARVRAPLPEVITGAATAVDSTRATLNGIVEPHGVPGAEAWFEWGATAALGLSTPVTQIGSTVQRSFSTTISGLSVQTTYHYRIAARTVAGTVRGDILTFQTTARDTVPAAPVLTALADGPSVSLEWETSGGLPATEYRVERRVGTGGSWIQIGTLSGSQPTQFPDSPGGGPFDYRVRGCNVFGCSVYSNVETLLLDPTAPYVLTLEPTAITDSSAMLNGYLRPNGSITSWWFEIDVQAEFAEPEVCPGGESGLGSHSDWIVACQITGLLPGSFYYVRLVAENSDGQSEAIPILLETIYYLD